MTKKVILFSFFMSAVVFGGVLYAASPQMIRVKADKVTHHVGEKAFIQISTPVQPTNPNYEYLVRTTLNDVEIKTVSVTPTEAYALTNPLTLGPATLRFTLQLQDKKFVRDTLVAIAGYKKRNAEIDERLAVETDQVVRTSLQNQKQRNLSFINQANQNLISHRTQVGYRELELTVVPALTKRKKILNPIVNVHSERQNGKYLIDEIPVFFVSVSTGLDLEDGPAEFLAEGKYVNESDVLSRKRTGYLDFSFTGPKFNSDDIGGHEFETSVFYRSKAQSDSIRNGLTGIVAKQKEYISLRNKTTDVAEKEYYNFLLSELETAKLNFQSHLASLLQILGSPVRYEFEVLGSAQQLIGVQVTSGLTGNLNEGSSFQLSLVLKGEPSQDVVITLDPSSELNIGSAQGGTPVSLTFTALNWNVPQVVAVTAIEDSIDRGASYAASIGYSVSSLDTRYEGMVVPNSTIVVSDNDEGQIAIDGELFIGESEAGTFQVRLNSQPTSDVTLSLTTDAFTTVTESTLIFTSLNWNEWQTVEVTAVDDNIDRADEYASTVTLTSSSSDTIYSGLTTSIVATIYDNDTAGIRVTVSGGHSRPQVSEEGQTALVRVRLRSEPTTDVTVSFDTGDQLQAISPITFNSSNWNSNQTIEVAAVDDSVFEGEHTGTILMSASGGGYSNVDPVELNVDIEDNDVETGFSAISTGEEHACGIKQQKLFCWGRNALGNLGTGDDVNRLVPTLVPGLNNVSAVGAGFFITCAINDGALYCWGGNFDGQLGDGTLVDKLSPQLVPGMSAGVSSVEVGRTSVCAIKGGDLFCWGANTYGELGNGNKIRQLSPIQISLPASVEKISVGWMHSCAIVTGGAVYCWGYNSGKQLGNEPIANTDSLIPVIAGEITSGATAVVAGHGNSCAIVDGGLKCWGASTFLATGETAGSTNYATTIVGLNSNVSSVEANYRSICAVQAGVAKCWGDSERGAIGAGTTGWELYPITPTGLNSNVSAIAVGNKFGCAVQSGVVKCWGANVGGNIGDGTDTPNDSLIPVEVVDPGVKLKKFRKNKRK